MRSNILRFLPGLFVVFVLCGVDVAAQSPAERLRVTYSAIGGSQAAVWIPYEAGIFRKYGLDIELLYVGGEGRAAQVVQSGEVPIGLFTGGAVINSNLAGGDLVLTGQSRKDETELSHLFYRHDAFLQQTKRKYGQEVCPRLRGGSTLRQDSARLRRSGHEKIFAQ